MDSDARRSILRSITDEQYDDIINVLSIYPHVTMDVSCEVFDDEEVHKITTGAVVTLTIHLQRENMSTVFNKEIGSNSIDNTANEDQRDDKENQEKTNETSKAAAAAAASNTSKGWNNKSDKKKKTKKKGQTSSSKPINTSSNKQSITPVVNKNPTKDSSG
jgi:translocation protein SEC63